MNDGKNASKAYQKTSSSVSLAEFTQLYFSANCIRSETAGKRRSTKRIGRRSVKNDCLWKRDACLSEGSFGQFIYHRVVKQFPIFLHVPLDNSYAHIYAKGKHIMGLWWAF